MIMIAQCFDWFQVRPSTSSKSRRAPEPTSNAAAAAGADGEA